MATKCVLAINWVPENQIRFLALRIQGIISSIYRLFTKSAKIATKGVTAIKWGAAILRFHSINI